MESTHTTALNIPEFYQRCIHCTFFTRNGKPFFTFRWKNLQQRIHSHFQEYIGHNLQFSAASNFEMRSRLGNWTLANKPAKRTSTTTTGRSK
jgi:hypothetical protein